MSNDTKVSFAQRCALLDDAAETLKRLADTVKLEALRMNAAHERFSHKRPKASR